MIKELTETMTDEFILSALDTNSTIETDHLIARARELKERIYGTGCERNCIIEISNYCWENCSYCRFRRDNRDIVRYRLCKEEILTSCRRAYQMGFRRLILESGDDDLILHDFVLDLMKDHKRELPDIEIALSLGVRERRYLRHLRKTGSDKYLLRFETAVDNHFQILHPWEQSLENRMKAIENVQKAGFRLGTGFIAGAPGDTFDTYLENIKYIDRIRPEMISINPFKPFQGTLFNEDTPCSDDFLKRLIAIFRLRFPGISLSMQRDIRPDEDIFSRNTDFGANVMLLKLVDR